LQENSNFELLLINSYLTGILLVENFDSDQLRHFVFEADRTK